MFLILVHPRESAAASSNNSLLELARGLCLSLVGRAGRAVALYGIRVLRALAERRVGNVFDLCKQTGASRMLPPILWY